MKKSAYLSSPIFILWLNIILIACQNFNLKEEVKQKHLQEIDVSKDTPSLKKKLDSLKISFPDVYKYCKSSRALFRKTKLIESVCWDAKNNLEQENKDYWQAVLYDLQDFSDLISLLKEEKHKTFIDIGSGNGEKAFAALCLGFEKAYGLEYSATLVNLSRGLFKDFVKENKMQIIHQDALLIKNNFFAAFDFIYLYSPIKDNRKMASVFHKAMVNMKEGAILAEVRLVYAEELQQISGYEIPLLADLALKKENKRYYYAQFDSRFRNKKWIPLKKLKSRD